VGSNPTGPIFYNSNYRATRRKTYKSAKLGASMEIAEMFIGTQEIILIALIVLILFGASKIPEVARSLGRGVAEFKKAQKEAEMELRELEKKMEMSKEERRTKLEKIARDLGINPEGKSDEALLDEIERALPKVEKSKP
jgi:sec-independent protein translocase protein TatA